MLAHVHRIPTPYINTETYAIIAVINLITRINEFKHAEFT